MTQMVDQVARSPLPSNIHSSTSGGGGSGSGGTRDSGRAANSIQQDSRWDTMVNSKFTALQDAAAAAAVDSGGKNAHGGVVSLADMPSLDSLRKFNARRRQLAAQRNKQRQQAADADKKRMRDATELEMSITVPALAASSRDGDGEATAHAVAVGTRSSAELKPKGTPAAMGNTAYPTAGVSRADASGTSNVTAARGTSTARVLPVTQTRTASATSRGRRREQKLGVAAMFAVSARPGGGKRTQGNPSKVAHTSLDM